VCVCVVVGLLGVEYFWLFISGQLRDLRAAHTAWCLLLVGKRKRQTETKKTKSDTNTANHAAPKERVRYKEKASTAAKGGGDTVHDIASISASRSPMLSPSESSTASNAASNEVSWARVGEGVGESKEGEAAEDTGVEDTALSPTLMVLTLRDARVATGDAIEAGGARAAAGTGAGADVGAGGGVGASVGAAGAPRAGELEENPRLEDEVTRLILTRRIEVGPPPRALVLVFVEALPGKRTTRLVPEDATRDACFAGEVASACFNCARDLMVNVGALVEDASPGRATCRSCLLLFFTPPTPCDDAAEVDAVAAAAAAAAGLSELRGAAVLPCFCFRVARLATWNVGAATVEVALPRNEIRFRVTVFGFSGTPPSEFVVV